VFGSVSLRETCEVSFCSGFWQRIIEVFSGVNYSTPDWVGDARSDSRLHPHLPCCGGPPEADRPGVIRVPSSEPVLVPFPVGHGRSGRRSGAIDEHEGKIQPAPRPRSNLAAQSRTASMHLRGSSSGATSTKSITNFGFRRRKNSVRYSSRSCLARRSIGAPSQLGSWQSARVDSARPSFQVRSAWRVLGRQLV